jgi:hypothetical protein
LVPSNNLLADFALDVWLVARFTPDITGAPLDGRQWEQAVSSLLRRPGLTRHQGPGSHSLFGSASASGVRHEIDAAADGWRGSLVVECKTTVGGITKADAALFHFKVMDFYQRSIEAAYSDNWWCLMCGSTPTPIAARAAAISLGLFICDPARLPLPVLLRAAGNPAADMHLPETLLQEIVRLGERALLSQQKRWPYRPVSGEIAFRPDRWKEKDIKDLLWLEDELSSHLLDLFERQRSGLLSRCAERLILRARKVA